jgi:hypothetical protein
MNVTEVICVLAFPVLVTTLALVLIAKALGDAIRGFLRTTRLHRERRGFEVLPPEGRK